MAAPTAVLLQDDDAVDYTPNADVAAGDVVVQAALIGIATSPIPANTLGALATEGQFVVPKATGGGSGIAAGATVYWDATNKVATVTAQGNVLMGKTTKIAADADTTVRVRLFQ